jgi:tetratricopeptide (TPR) repeat protein
MEEFLAEISDPENPKRYYYQGLKYASSDSTADQASEMFRRSVQMKPDLAEGWYQIGLLFNRYRKDNKDYKDSVKYYYQKAVNLNPSYEDAVMGLNWIYRSENNHELQISLLNKLLDEWPSSIRGWNYLADAYIQNKDPENALLAAQKQINVFPDEHDGFVNISIANIHLKEYEEAVKMSRKGLEKDPSSGYCAALLVIGTIMMDHYEDGEDMILDFLENDSGVEYFESNLLHFLDSFEEQGITNSDFEKIRTLINN